MLTFASSRFSAGATAFCFCVVGSVWFMPSSFHTQSYISVCLKMFYPPSEQFSLHSSRLFCFSASNSWQLQHIMYQCYLVLFVWTTRNLLLVTSKRCPATSNSRHCVQYATSTAPHLLPSGTHLVLAYQAWKHSKIFSNFIWGIRCYLDKKNDIYFLKRSRNNKKTQPALFK